jgi:hypothetical protein
MNEQLLNKYFELRNDIDKDVAAFETMHKLQLKCKKGCDSCCESLTLFPIEYFAIQNELGTNANLPSKKWLSGVTKSCRFLIKGECSIYNSRPIICRTQGLPLLYENFEGTGFELSVCKLNFKGVDVTKFNKETALFMSPFNSRLFLLNSQFIKNTKEKYKPTQRLSLNDFIVKTNALI